MRTRKTNRFLRTTGQIVPLLAIAGTVTFAGQLGALNPPVDGDYPGLVATGVEYTFSGNPLDKGDLIYSLRVGYRPPSGHVGFEGLLSVADPTSPFARSLGLDADLLLLDLSIVGYLNYPPHIDRDCGGKRFAENEIRPWHCGKRIKPEWLVFGGPGLAILTVDDAFQGSPISDASRDFFTLHAGFAVRLHWLKDTPAALPPGLGYQARKTSHWFLQPEVRARWFDGGNGDIDWGVGLAIGRGFGGRDTDGALCLQIEEVCHLSERVLDWAGTGDEVRQVGADAAYRAIEDRRSQLQEYRARATAAGVECGACLDRQIEALNGGLDALR